jgi:hypothetical protein
MSAFILIGIGCDDIFVFFDTWDQEKAEWLRKYQDRQQIGKVKKQKQSKKKIYFFLF